MNNAPISGADPFGMLPTWTKFGKLLLRDLRNGAAEEVMEKAEVADVDRILGHDAANAVDTMFDAIGIAGGIETAIAGDALIAAALVAGVELAPAFFAFGLFEEIIGAGEVIDGLHDTYERYKDTHRRKP